MTDLSRLVSDSRFGSVLRRIRPDDDGSGGGRFLAAAGFVAVLLSAASSVVAYGPLPGRIRIHWTLGMGPYYGPEFAPTAAVLAAFPILVAAGALGAAALDARVRHVEGFAAVRPYYVLATLGTLGVLLTVQVALVVANL